jgi:SAM-dependent methyltransferase
MRRVPDVLRPSAEAALRAWAERVRANRQQVEAYREASPADFYAPIAAMFRADPRREDEPALNLLRSLIEPADVVLDIGAGGGRYALPLALVARKVVAIDPSDGMLNVLREGIAEHGLGNIEVVSGRWPPGEPETAPRGDVALISHVGYDVEDIGPFLEAMERAAARVCIAVLLDRPPPTEADRLWPLIHGVERASLPALPEFLALLLARERLFEVRLVERGVQSYAEPEQALAWLRGQFWTRPEGDKDRALQRLLRERLQERDGRYALSWEPARVGIVTWRPPRAD